MLNQREPTLERSDFDGASLGEGCTSATVSRASRSHGIGLSLPTAMNQAVHAVMRVPRRARQAQRTRARLVLAAHDVKCAHDVPASKVRSVRPETDRRLRSRHGGHSSATDVSQVRDFSRVLLKGRAFDEHSHQVGPMWAARAVLVVLLLRRAGTRVDISVPICDLAAAAAGPRVTHLPKRRTRCEHLQSRAPAQR